MNSYSFLKLLSIVAFITLFFNDVSANVPTTGFKAPPTSYDNYTILSQYFGDLGVPNGGLWVWTGIGRSFRSSFTYGKFPIDENKAAYGEVPLNFSSIAKFAIPLFVFAGIMLILFVVSIGYGIFLCCKRKRIFYKRTKRELTTRSAIVFIILSFLMFFIFFFAALCGIRSSVWGNDSVNVMADNVHRTFSSTLELIDSFNHLFSDIIDSNEETVQAFASNVSYFGSSDSVQSYLDEIVEIRNAASTAASIVSALNSLSTQYSNSRTSLQLAISTATSSYQELLTDVTAPYYFPFSTETVTVSIAATNTAAVQSPIPTGIDGSLGTLTDSGYTFEGTDLESLEDTAETLQVEVSAFRSDLSSRMDLVSSDALNSFNNIRQSALSSTTPISESIIVYEENISPYIESARKYKNVIVALAIVFFAIPLIFIIVQIFGLVLNKFGLIRVTIYVGAVFYVICFILTIVMSVLSVVSSHACALAFDKSDGDPILVEYSDSFFGESFGYDELWLLRNSCLQNVSFWQSLDSTFGNLPNISEEMRDYIDYRLPINQIALPSTPITGVSVPPMVNTALQLYDAQLEALNDLKTDFNSMVSVLLFINNLTESDVDITGSNDPAVRTQALMRFKSALLEEKQAAIELAVSLLVSTSGVVNDQISNVNALNNSFTALSSLVLNAGNTSQIVLDAFSEIISNSIITLADGVLNAADRIYDEINCVSVGLVLADSEVGVCDGFQLSADGIFLSLFIISCLGLISMPFLIYIMRIIDNSDFNFGKSADSLPKTPDAQYKWTTGKDKTKDIEKAPAAQESNVKLLHTATMDDWEDDEYTIATKPMNAEDTGRFESIKEGGSEESLNSKRNEPIAEEDEEMSVSEKDDYDSQYSEQETGSELKDDENERRHDEAAPAISGLHEAFKEASRVSQYFNNNNGEPTRLSQYYDNSESE